MNDPKPRRGFATIEDLKRRSVVDPVTHCWHWQGAKAVTDGIPRIHAFDHQRGEKRTMSGPRAVWNIAHNESPRALVYRGCQTTDCVNPAHHRQAWTAAEIGQHIRLAAALRRVLMGAAT